MKKLQLLSWKVSAGKKEWYSPAAHRRHAVFSGKLQKKNTWLVKAFIKLKSELGIFAFFRKKKKIFNLMLNIFLLTQLAQCVSYQILLPQPQKTIGPHSELLVLCEHMFILTWLFIITKWVLPSIEQ